MSIEFVNTSTKMRWLCANGHEWSAVLSDIKKGGWCPECLPYVREGICRVLLEELTGFNFKKKRFDWLTNSRGNKMELDGYCDELKLAFEHHGEYHYKKISHFQRDSEKLELRMEDDERKRFLCKEQNINLLEIDYTIAIDNIIDFIVKYFNEHYAYVALNEIKDIGKIKFASNTKLKDMRDFVEEKGGKLLSTIYKGSAQYHKFECSKGHQWDAFPINVMKGKKTWCPTCKPDRIGISNTKYNIDDMINLAKTFEGHFLSSFFKSVNDAYKWKCKNNHEWEISPADVLRGSWCAKCNLEKRREGRLAEMKVLAVKRKGKCLSDAYLNSYGKLLWECEKGHQWSACPNNVSNGSWCPVCRKRMNYNH